MHEHRWNVPWYLRLGTVILTTIAFALLFTLLSVPLALAPPAGALVGITILHFWDRHLSRQAHPDPVDADTP